LVGDFKGEKKKIFLSSKLTGEKTGNGSNLTSDLRKVGYMFSQEKRFLHSNNPQDQETCFIGGKEKGERYQLSI